MSGLTETLETCKCKEESLSITVFVGVTKILRGKPYHYVSWLAIGGDLEGKKGKLLVLISPTENKT